MGLADVALLLNHEQQMTLLRLRPEQFTGDTAGWALARAMAYRVHRDTTNAGIYFDSARVVLQRRLAVRPEDHLFHAGLGLGLAGLGRAAEAVPQGKRAVELRAFASPRGGEPLGRDIRRQPR